MGKFRTDYIKLYTGSGWEVKNIEFLLFCIVWRVASMGKLGPCSNKMSPKD